MGQLVKINPDGSMSITEAKKADGDQIRELIGGCMERIRVRYEGRIRDAYVDEEGIMKGLPVNQPVTKMLDGVFKNYAGQIHGPAVVWIPTPRSKRVKAKSVA